MLDHRVTVIGSWVRDRAHYADGSGKIPPAPFGDGD